MNYIFILTIIISIYLVFLGTKNEDIFFGFFIGFFGFVIQWIIIIVISFILWFTTGQHYIEENVYNIVSMEREMTINGRYSGNFILGSGYIESKPQYFCYIKVNENEYKLFNFPTNDSSLILNDTVEPEIHATYRYFEAKWMVKYFGMSRDFEGLSYKFIVPIKTIVREFKG
jgi:hypothetical protein